MISSEVQRTLVKSPPELWAELGDPASLARHLGALGEIRITRIEPEQAVEWEAKDTTGTVLIRPSGWGTKVTLTVTRETQMAEAPLAEDPPAEAGHPVEPEANGEVEPTAEIELEAAAEIEPEPTAETEPTRETEPEPAAEVETEPAPQAEAGPTMQAVPEPAGWDVAAPLLQAEPESAWQMKAEPEPELVPRRGFFSRLFGRRTREAVAEPEPAEPDLPVASLEPEPAEPDLPVASLEPEPAEPDLPIANLEPEPTEPDAPVASLERQSPEPQPPLAREPEQPAESVDSSPQEVAARLEESEAAAAGEVTAVLTAVLDRLGAAHHRPFSRG